MRRVLYITPTCDLGGEELSTLSVACGVREAGYEVELATEGGPFVAEFEAVGIPVTHLPLNARRPIGIWRASRELRAHLARNPVDLVHSQEVFPTVMTHLARRVPGRRPERLIYHYRGVRPVMMPAVRRVLPGMSDFIITNAEANRRLFTDHGTSADHVRTIYNGFDWAPFDERHDAAEVRAEWGVPAGVPVVGAVGRLHPVKGHRVLVQAAPRIRERCPQAQIVIVGDGELRGELEAQARSLGVADVVRFLGFRRDVARQLAGMDVLVLPSIEEAIGRVLAEAHAVGLPAVASRVGGTGEIVRDGVSGYLVSPGDATALADRVVDLVLDPDRARTFGEAGRADVRARFGEAKMITDTLEVYEGLLSS